MDRGCVPHGRGVRRAACRRPQRGHPPAGDPRGSRATAALGRAVPAHHGRDGVDARAGRGSRALLPRGLQGARATGAGHHASAEVCVRAQGPLLCAAPGRGRGSLRPLSIQIGQDASSPVFYPDGGLAWTLAKTCVNIADGNYHELISHLGLTHLLTEPFVLATERQLDPQHPLYVLLTPHFAGTLFINYSAATSLITPGGPVDKLLAGTIDSSNQVAANAVKAVRYNESFFPEKLARQGIGSPEELPDYPYRDDALALWKAIHEWVSDYTALYYSGEADVVGDYELQAWVQELVSAGHLQDIGEGGPMERRASPRSTTCASCSPRSSSPRAWSTRR
ncbi:lipoxygenase family protein [Cystobacter fuscus]